jgi:hypothetical protein
MKLLVALVLAAGVLGTSAAWADKRIALVIGNANYSNIARLDNPANDARLMGETLRDAGFTLIGGAPQSDLDKTAFDRAVQDFGRALQGADVALFYYAGHGVQVAGSNYLVPVNANLTRTADVDFQMLDVGAVLRQMEGSGSKLNLVILDACRNNPFGGRGLRAASGGLAQMQAPEGTLISYATQPGGVARDGTDGNSPYTKALAQTIRRPGLGIFEVFNEVGLAVKQMTGGDQQPWVSSSPIAGRFRFAERPGNEPGGGSEAERAWTMTRDSSDPAVLDAFIKRFGDSFYGDLARARLNDLKNAKADPARKEARLPDPSTATHRGAGSAASAVFGGPPYCKYRVTMQDLELKASVDNAGAVTDAELTATMVETTVGNCPFAPIGRNNHFYSGAGAVSGDTVTIALNAAAGNKPRAAANFRGRIVDGRLVGQLTLRRNDIGGNLAWAIQSAVK